MPGTWSGHYEGCREPILHGVDPPPPTQTFNPENIIGPDGHPVWCVVASMKRINTMHTETVHVRAADLDGAILLAKELFPEPFEDVDAYRITERMA